MTMAVLVGYDYWDGAQLWDETTWDGAEKTLRLEGADARRFKRDMARFNRMQKWLDKLWEDRK